MGKVSERWPFDRLPPAPPSEPVGYVTGHRGDRLPLYRMGGSAPYVERVEHGKPGRKPRPFAKGFIFGLLGGWLLWP
jgi:hypothetical protein